MLKFSGQEYGNQEQGRDHFEGVGMNGIKWLRQVKRNTGLLTTVEVANPEHVEAALKYGIDILWIGARTVVNPFSLQDLADILMVLIFR